MARVLSIATVGIAVVGVTRLGVGVALLRQGAQLADVDGQRLVVMLHELGQVEQRLRHLG